MTASNLFDFFKSKAPNDPATPFLELGDGKVVSYGDMDARTAQIAHVLKAAGVEPGGRVAAQVDKSPEALLIYLASLRAGAVYLPLNNAYTNAEIDYFLSDAEPAVFVCRPKDAEAIRPLADKAGVKALLTLNADGTGSLTDAADKHPKTFETVDRAADDLAAILYTSGTTGRPKGAMLTHNNMQSNCTTLRDLWQFTANDRLLHALPIFHTHGLFVATNVTLASGATIIFFPRFDADELISNMPKASVLMGVPTFYSRLLASETFTKDVASKMRLFISGSAPLSAETHAAFKDRCGHAILERYGMTETNMIASNPYEGDRKPGSVGHPLDGVDVRIADTDGAPLAQGDIGGIEVRGPNVFTGYWRRPEKTAEEFRDGGWFITGDLGHFDDDGYLHIDGRAKDLIISGGFNVYPAEVEAAIDGLPGIDETAVIGVPHADFGEGVVAVVAGGSSDEKTVLEGLSELLARYKQPKRVIFLDALPRNAMGKIEKAKLRETYADLLK
ncbi:MAG: malonyl-CoA synthase [Pseudomonadota bacterium]